MNNIKKFKYLILGAGPSGLTFANRLLEKGEKSFLLIEKESEAGGLCRSVEVDGHPLDIGGGHFLDVKREEVLKFLFKFLPKKDWNEYGRISTIKLDNPAAEIDYPFESNIWQFPVKKQLDYLLSITRAGSNLNTKMPEKFVDWIYWKLGDQIAKDYMVPYNKKIWSINLNKLGTYWLYKLPNVSFEETLLSCLERKPSGSMPAHAKFLYPKKYGYGEVWKRMADKLKDKIIINTPVREISYKNRLVNGSFQASKIISTIPWREIKFKEKVSQSIKKDIGSLEFSSIRVAYHKSNAKTKAHWTYLPSESIAHHRELYRHNFCSGSRGYWTEMNEKRLNLKKEKSSWHYINKYAYPLNTIKKPESIERILKYFSRWSIYGLGRWGEWNSDVSVERGLNLADKFLEKP